MSEYDSSSVRESEKKARIFKRGIGKNGKMNNNFYLTVTVSQTLSLNTSNGAKN